MRSWREYSRIIFHSWLVAYGVLRDGVGQVLVGNVIYDKRVAYLGEYG